ncbi:MAG TPA: ABC transporter permease, partial [candidate division WOR-3 bacterium]|nr:ABC transporter permease [candidate division WOR-3 bacterium]
MWKLAFKNLLRDKRRTLLTFGILTVAITYYIVITGMLGGFEKESIRNFIALQSSHMVIRSEDFNEETLEGYIETPSEIENKLE